MTTVQLVLLLVAGADLAVGVMLIRRAPRASRPEPARITGLLLLACAAGLLVLVGARREASPAAPAPFPSVPPAGVVAPADASRLLAVVSR